MQTSNPGKSTGTSHPSPSVAAVLVGGAAFASTMQNPTDGILCQGWLLKKRRKKMQGYAKRYFTLSSQGILSYAFQPSAPIRDQITLRLASITSSANERSRAIHIDSAAVTFHLKALGPTDYTIWMSALRRFCTFAVNPNAPEPAMSPRSARGSISMSRSWSLPAQTARALLAAQDMNTTIKELENLVSELTSLEPTKKKSKHHKDKDKDKDHHHNKDLLKLFHRKGHQGTPTSTPITPSFPSDTGSLSPDPLSPTMGSPPSSPPNSLNQLERLQAAVATLRAQHNALVNVIEGGVSGPGQTGSPLLRVQEDIAMNSPRHSLGTLESVSPSVWFDAEEGAEEFVLVAEPTESGQTSATASDVDEAEANDAGSDDTLDREADSHTTPTLTPTKSSFATERLDGSVKAVVRRTRLPHPTSGDDGSLLTVLRKNVGKDLSTVSFPVSFNEPISILQRLAEDVEYVDLLEQAVAATDPIERICLMAAFAVSGYACTLYRASRKPFNPMLGETFEDTRMKFVAEKVSHHPPVMACHASGEGWEYWATNSADSKFWGRSLEIITKGTSNVKIGNTHYQWQGRKPSSFMRNLLVGEKYLAHEGEMVVTELNSGRRCVITFKEGGYWGGSRGVHGVVYGPSSSSALARIDGSWNEGVSLQLDPKGSHLRVLWRANPFPSHSQQYYGFTSFTMTLNEITPDITDFLPPTDSRHRPDQRAMEEGDIDFADREKERLEAAQRTRRKQREERGENWVPLWFEPVPGAQDEWRYKGGYWEARALKQWDMSPKLW